MTRADVKKTKQFRTNNNDPKIQWFWYWTNKLPSVEPEYFKTDFLNVHNFIEIDAN